METSVKRFLENIETYKQDKQEHFTIVVQDETEVTYGFDKDCNIDYCIEHNIPVFDRKGTGGCIVHCKGSIGINHIYSHDKYPEFLSTKMINDMCKYFVSKDLNATLDRNDILIDGYKVASCAENNLEPDYKWCNSVVLISINQDLDTIKNVCKKEMVKTPKGLIDFGITTEEMYQWCIEWFDKNNVTINK